MVRPHDEILKNQLMSKTGYIEFASRLEFGINLVSVPTPKALSKRHPLRCVTFLIRNSDPS
jgi:hypothetical protein